MSKQLAKVIPLFPGLKTEVPADPSATCFNCTHAAFRNRGGTFCVKYAEEIFNEAETAKDCGDFEADDDDF